jgi:hypothetical protein
MLKSVTIIIIIQLFEFSINLSKEPIITVEHRIYVIQRTIKTCLGF